MASAAPPVRRRLVGRALRQYRESMGYTLDDVARMLECDRSKMSRVETGERGIRGKELRELLAEFGVAGDQQAILELLASPRGARGWFREYDSVLRGAWQGLPDPRDGRIEDLGLRGPAGPRAAADSRVRAGAGRGRPVADRRCRARRRSGSGPGPAVGDPRRGPGGGSRDHRAGGAGAAGRAARR